VSDVLPEGFEDDSISPSSKKPEREGLPPGYRMRADAHYVELLSSKRDRSEARGSKRDREAMESDTDVRDRRSDREHVERLIAQLSEDMSAIEASATLLAGGAPAVARRVNLDIIRAHAWRAAWVLRAQALVDGGARVQPRPKQLASLLGHVRSGFAPEGRLNSISLHVQASDWNAVVPVDEAAFVAGLTGAIVATVGLIGPADSATIAVTVTASPGELRTVDITQDDVSISGPIANRFFDSSWTERQGGWTAALGAATARAAAEYHGGDAALVASPRNGSTIRLSFRPHTT